MLVVEIMLRVTNILIYYTVAVNKQDRHIKLRHTDRALATLPCGERTYIQRSDDKALY